MRSSFSWIRVFLFLVVFIIALFLRSQELFTNNYLFLIDQGRDMMKVKEIVFDHHLTLIGPYTSLGGVFQGPFYYYLIALPTFLTKGDPIGPLFLMVIISLATAAVAFFWMRKLFGFKPAIIAFILFAISPEAVAAATYTWNPHPMWLLITVYIFSLFEIVLGRKKFNLVLWPILGLMFHFEMALGVFLFAATLLYFVLFQRNKLNKYVVFGLLVASLIFLPQIVFEFRHDFLMSKSVITIFSGKDKGLAVTGENIMYLSLLDNHKGELINNFRSGFIVRGILTYFPFLLFIMMIVFIVWGRKYKMAKVKEHQFILTIAKIVGLVVFISMFYLFPLRYWFFTGFQVFYLLVAALVLSKLFNYKLGKVFVVVLFLAFGYHTVTRLDTLYFHPPDDGGIAKIKGKREAIEYIYKDASSKPFGLLVFTPPVYTFAYDYLIWWYGSRKYNYTPHAEKKGLFYLLMEPDPSKPWSYKGWLETVIKTGKILETKTLPSGFIVQKRIQE